MVAPDFDEIALARSLMNRTALKKLFFALLLAIVSLLAVSAWKLSIAIGGIEEIQRASDDLQMRRMPIGAQLRSQIYRLNASMLRHQVTDDPGVAARFRTFETQLKRFIEERRPLLDSREEKEILQKIDDGLMLYFIEADALIAASANNESAERTVERIERIKEMADETVELANALANARSEAFRDLLQEHRDSARRLQRAVTVGFTLLLAGLAGLAWLAWKVFFSPLQSQLREAQTLAGQREELANIGTLASGIAHEIRNPITAMKARTFALAELVAPGSPAARQAEVIDKELGRMERVVRDFLDFARPAEPDTEMVDVDAFLAELAEFVRPEMESRHVELNSVEGEGGRARIDAAQMRQVLLNLVRNAAEACAKQGGRVTLSARGAGGKLRIAVADNGAGIPKAFQGRLFEPFFSKKHGGTGLGLPIARTIVRKHGGELSFETREGLGSTFFIELDAVSEV